MSVSPCAPRAHQFFTIEDLSHFPDVEIPNRAGESEIVPSEFPRTGILIKCAFCGEERELWKGEEITQHSPGYKVTDTPEADTDPTIFITPMDPEA
jgi:hypothetical protein